MKHDLKTMFPKASKSFLDSNPSYGGVVVLKPNQNATTVNLTPKRGIMNKTETDYAMILEAMKRKGEILRYEFEGVTLRFANVKYTPDFVVFSENRLVKEFHSGLKTIETKLVEVKGPFIRGNRERAVERFRHAKTYWPEFTFEMHQKTKEGWKQII